MDDVIQDFPEEGQSQEIGRYARSVFMNAKPSDWIETELAGDSDFGFDYQVQVKVNRQVKYTFRVQLKGTTKPRWINDGQVLSFRLSTQALNMYVQTPEPTLLVVCVVPEDLPRPYAGEAYYVWVDDALPDDFVKPALGTEPRASHAIHLPVANLLTYENDVTTHLDARNRLFRTAVDISDLVTASTGSDFGTPYGAIQALETALSTRPSVITALIEESDIWPAPPEGTAISDLLAIAEAMRNGSWDRATQMHRRIRPETLNNLELAEYTFLDGKLLSRSGKFSQAIEKYEAASRLVPTRDVYIVAAAETRFVRMHPCDDAECRDLLTQLDSRNSVVAKVLAARLLIALSDEAAADSRISSLPATDRAILLASLHVHRRRFSNAIEICSESLRTTTLSPRERATLLLMRARSRWYEAVGPLPDEVELPLSGPADANLSLLQMVWEDVMEAFPLLRELGWPANVEFLSDVAGSTAMMLNRGSELYPYLEDAAQALPWSVGLQQAFEALCVSLGRFKEALIPNSRLPESPSVIGRRVTLFHQAGDLPACWALADDKLTVLSESTNVAPVAIGMGATAATQCTKPLVSSRLLSVLDSRQDWGEYATFFRTAIESQRRGVDATTWVEALRLARTKHPDSIFIAQNLLGSLNANLAEHAPAVLETASFLRKTQQLNFNDTLKVIKACFTLERWGDVDVEASHAIERFGNSARLLAMRAIALDNAGKTADALDEYEQGFSSDDAALELLRAYLGLCIRLSHFDRAINAIERLLSRVRGHDEIVELKRLLIVIKAEVNASPQEMEALLRDLSFTVAQDDAEEEALYLSIATNLTFIRGLKLSDDMCSDFHTRSNAYSSRFPDSRNFIVLSTPPEDSGDRLLKILEPILGDWRAKGREYLRREREVKDGRLPIPYIVRAGYALHYVGDPLTLWEIGKISRAEFRQFHLTMATEDMPEALFESYSRPPLVDLTALLVLLDLDMLDTVFHLWPSIAIGRLTVAYLSQLSSNRIESARGHDTAKRLISFIQDNLSRIEQPKAHISGASGHIQPIHLVQEAEALRESGFSLYADDFFVRVFTSTSISLANSFCTLDVLRWATERKFLDLQQVSGRYSLLCRWNVAIVIPLQVFLEPVLREPFSLDSLEQVAFNLAHVETFDVLSRAVWWPDKDYLQLLNHVRAVIVVLLQNARVPLNLVASVWSAWLMKVQFAKAGLSRLDNRAAAMFFIAVHAESELLKRAWICYKLTVELEHGNRMEKAHEREAIRHLAAFANEFAQSQSTPNSQTMLQRLQDCVTPGTEEAQWFSEGLMDAMVGIFTRDRQQTDAILGMAASAVTEYQRKLGKT
ncbi:tetratricopeptide repeat protein [Caballeronia sordidicola]|uniref:tetratricopeptide repeat protein n=1 Tax=Caballeronia sordidicola TaxID=196367 RepID=UPI0004CFEF9A|nr:DUF4365 domain-containing protein [Caballeronia sordidicola]